MELEIYDSNQNEIERLHPSDVDCYRGSQRGCDIYLKDGSVIYSTLSFDEVDKILNQITATNKRNDRV